MRPILAKEIRALLPFFWLFIFVTVIGYVGHAMGDSITLERIDQSYGEGLIDLDLTTSVVMFLIAMTISYGLLIREIDDQTIEFLDSLPVSRTQLFAAKWVAALGTLMVLPVLDSLFMGLMRWVATDSLDRSLHLDWLATSTFLQCVQLFCFFSIGLVLSFFRRFGWLMVGLMAWALIVAGQISPAWGLRSLPLFAEVQFSGTRWLIPWPKVGVYLVVGCVCSGLACAMFHRAGRRSIVLHSTPSRLRQVFLMGTSVLIVLVFFGALMMGFSSVDDSADDDDGPRALYPSWATTTRRTQHFTATFPTNLSKRAGVLMDQADGIYDRVVDFFAAERQPPVQLDLTSRASHNLGNANWNSVKMDLSVDTKAYPLEETLGHEMAHVVMESLADGLLFENFAFTRFFHEGVATYVERRLFTDDTLVDRRLIAAIVADRKEADLERLIDNDVLRREHDSYLAYALGEVFAAAVVNRFGDQALGDLARVFAVRRHSEGLSGVALWRSVFQAAGYSFSEATDEYYRLLGEAKRRHAESIASLPEVYPAIEVERWSIRFDFDQPPPDGYELIVRFRSSVDASDDQLWIETVRRGSAQTSRFLFATPTIWYQVGYQGQDDAGIYQPWESFVARGN